MNPLDNPIITDIENPMFTPGSTMNNSKRSLTQIYDDLKSQRDSDAGPREIPSLVGRPVDKGVFRNLANINADKLQDKCSKQVLLNIYCNIVPLDKSYIKGNMGQMKSDVDKFLAKKDMTATQYITSAYDKTEAPLVEYIMKSIAEFKNQYLREADDDLKQAVENKTNAKPKSVDSKDEEMDSQIVDIEKDMEYKEFIDRLKSKTKDKIVNDVSDIIIDEQENNDMQYRTSSDEDEEKSEDDNENNGDNGNDESGDSEEMKESYVYNSMKYMNRRMLKESGSYIDSDEMIGLAIRESSLHEIDLVFNQCVNSPDVDGYNISRGNGVLVNESVFQ